MKKHEWQVQVTRRKKVKNGHISEELPTIILPESLGIINNRDAFKVIKKLFMTEGFELSGIFMDWEYNCYTI